MFLQSRIVPINGNVRACKVSSIYIHWNRSAYSQSIFLLVILESIRPNCNKDWRVRVSPHDTVASFRKIVHSKTGMAHKEQVLVYNGTRIYDEDTFETLGVEQGDIIIVMGEQVGGKPVIYLFPPTCMSNVQVQLSLSNSWKFSELYPIQFDGRTYESIGDHITWTVDAKPDGTLHDNVTQRQVAYLFWEAR